MYKGKITSTSREQLRHRPKVRRVPNTLSRMRRVMLRIAKPANSTAWKSSMRPSREKHRNIENTINRGLSWYTADFFL